MAKELYGLKILVVDDDKDTLELLEWVLKRAGAEVTAVSSAKAAMEALERERPTILVSDIAMPEEDGLSLMRRIRALPKESAAAAFRPWRSPRIRWCRTGCSRCAPASRATCPSRSCRRSWWRW